MPKIVIDGRSIECRDNIPVLQAAVEAGWDVPHYCYHPGLSVVASCRLCLMEMKMPDPKTKELAWSPRLVPSCQTPVKDGLEVRFDSDKVRSNQQHCMEYFLLNHPLDCPVCDQAGECYLQDYSFKFGHATSRMIEAKTKNPKKDVGSKTLLYQDRCVMCSRCVRFTSEVAGTAELCIVQRGNRAEIDVFPGQPLENPLQGNVVDICPVGSLLDKDFLMKQRVWMLRSADSVCPGCATGCTIHVDQSDDRVYRLKPRFNPGVNDHWMCDDGRFGWKYVHDPRRVAGPRVRRGADFETPEWRDVPTLLRLRLEQVVAQHGADSVAGVLSPFMSCEEAWLLARFLRSLAPQALLTMRPARVAGEDQRFPVGQTNGHASRFVIHAEKAPNRRGVERVIEAMGGNAASFDEFRARTKAGRVHAAWVVGGDPAAEGVADLATALHGVGLTIAHEMLESELTAGAAIVLPACAWAEREGSFINAQGKLQPFESAVNPPGGVQRDGQYLYNLAGFEGLYRASRVRESMVASLPEFAHLHTPPVQAAHAH
ncbi:MAG: molybdopterin-dependent oxidoreductase [Phycisphaerae bacterium]